MKALCRSSPLRTTWATPGTSCSVAPGKYRLLSRYPCITVYLTEVKSEFMLHSCCLCVDGPSFWVKGAICCSLVASSGNTADCNLTLLTWLFTSYGSSGGTCSKKSHKSSSDDKFALEIKNQNQFRSQRDCTSFNSALFVGSGFSLSSLGSSTITGGDWTSTCI